MVKLLLFLAAMSLALPLWCGCATPRITHISPRITATIHVESEQDFYMCVYSTEQEKWAKDLQCISFEAWYNQCVLTPACRESLRKDLGTPDVSL